MMYDRAVEPTGHNPFDNVQSKALLIGAGVLIVVVTAIKIKKSRKPKKRRKK